MAGKFNLAEILAKAEGGPLAQSGDVSESDTSPVREQIEYINISRIDDDPNNFYELSGLDELAANIELLGLQQPLRVRPGEETGRYVIVSGHRRRAAVQKLIADGRRELRELPCIVERGEGSDALRELRLIYANSDTRKMTPADISRQAERVEALLYQLKEEGYEFPGRMRDHVAEACKVSRSKLARLKVIRENLAPCWQKRYEAGKLSESAAYTLAQMPGERQQVICDGLAKQGNTSGAVQECTVRTYGDSLARVDGIECATYGNGPCLNREAMRERVMSKDTWSCNCCRQCCEQCGELTHCKSACRLLADKVRQLKADAKAQRKQQQDAEEERQRSGVEQIQALWKRFREARVAAGCSIEKFFISAGLNELNAIDDDDLEEYKKLERLDGEFDSDTILPYGCMLELDDIRSLVGAADQFGVSLDYLLCRTDNPAGMAPQPEGQLVFSGWMPGRTLPSTPCDLVADFALETGKTIRRVCVFDGHNLRFKSGGSALEQAPIRWMALPPVGEGET